MEQKIFVDSTPGETEMSFPLRRTAVEGATADSTVQQPDQQEQQQRHDDDVKQRAAAEHHSFLSVSGPVQANSVAAKYVINNVAADDLGLRRVGAAANGDDDDDDDAAVLFGGGCDAASSAESRTGSDDANVNRQHGFVPFSHFNTLVAQLDARGIRENLLRENLLQLRPFIDASLRRKPSTKYTNLFRVASLPY
jgi:hypothetical protein